MRAVRGTSAVVAIELPERVLIASAIDHLQNTPHVVVRTVLRHAISWAAQPRIGRVFGRVLVPGTADAIAANKLVGSKNRVEGRGLATHVDVRLQMVFDRRPRSVVSSVVLGLEVEAAAAEAVELGSVYVHGLGD